MNCIEHTGSIRKDGYGTVWQDGRRKTAHRVAFELAHGEIPDGMCVCHACDNRKCVNPDHLFLGTYEDNNRDMTEKGRHVSCPGEKHGMRVLTEWQARFIWNCRHAFKYGGQAQLARMWGVSRRTINNITSGKRWRIVHGA